MGVISDIITMFDNIELFVNAKVRPNPNDRYSDECEYSRMSKKFEEEPVTEPDPSEIGRLPHYLGQWRKRARPRVTGEQMAEALNVSKSTISEYENYRHEISIKQLHRAADFLGIPVGYLIQYHPDNVPADILEMWAAVPEERKAEARRYLQIIRDSTG